MRTKWMKCLRICPFSVCDPPCRRPHEVTKTLSQQGRHARHCREMSRTKAAMMEALRAYPALVGMHTSEANASCSWASGICLIYRASLAGRSTCCGPGMGTDRKGDAVHVPHARQVLRTVTQIHGEALAGSTIRLASLPTSDTSVSVIDYGC